MHGMSLQVAINGTFLSKFLNHKEEDRIHQLLVDDERNILYSLDVGGRIQVDHLLSECGSFFFCNLCRT